jgi:hypothetical protein
MPTDLQEITGDHEALVGDWVLLEPRWNGAPGQLCFRPDRSYETKRSPRSRLSKPWDPGRFQVPFAHWLRLEIDPENRVAYEFFVIGSVLTLIDFDGHVVHFQRAP